MLLVPLMSRLILEVLPSYYVPVYIPRPMPMYDATATPEAKILDKLPLDSTVRKGRMAPNSMDTVRLILPRTVELDTARRDSTIRPDAERLAVLRSWADSALVVFETSARTRFARSCVLDSSVATTSNIKVGDSIPDSTRPIVVVDPIRLRTMHAGIGTGLGFWIGNLELTWGVWDPQRKVWALRGKRALRTSSTEVRDIPALEAGEYLAKQFYEPTVPKTVADPADAARRRLAFGGVHVLGEIGLALSVEGDSRKLARKEIDRSATISSGEFGARFMWIPNWYGFGAGAAVSSMDVRVDENSKSMWDIKTFYGVAGAYLPISKGESETSRNLLHGSLCVGRVGYSSGKVWRSKFSGAGLFYRPELGWTMVHSAFLVGLNFGMQFNSVEVEEFDFEDKIMRMGLQIGFRAGYR